MFVSETQYWNSWTSLLSKGQINICCNIKQDFLLFFFTIYNKNNNLQNMIWATKVTYLINNYYQRINVIGLNHIDKYK